MDNHDKQEKQRQRTDVVKREYAKRLLKIRERREIADMRTGVTEMRHTVNDIAIKGIKLK